MGPPGPRLFWYSLLLSLCMDLVSAHRASFISTIHQNSPKSPWESSVHTSNSGQNFSPRLEFSSKKPNIFSPRIDLDFMKRNKFPPRLYSDLIQGDLKKASHVLSRADINIASEPPRQGAEIIQGYKKKANEMLANEPDPDPPMQGAETILGYMREANDMLANEPDSDDDLLFP